MVALCQNGWPVIASASGVGSYVVPGTGGKVTARPGDSSVILLDWLGFWHAEVEPLIWPGVWGWAVRVVRGGSDASNHSGGDAVDANAPQHPLGTAPTANFSAAEIARIHDRLAAYREAAGGAQVVRWGGDYTGRKDGMHGELLGTVATRRTLADAIRQGRLPRGHRSYLVGAPSTGGAVTPTPTRPTTPGGPYRAIGIGGVTELNTSGEQVRRDQADLIESGFSVGKAGADGYAGPDTVSAIRAAQTAGFGPGARVDGAMGNDTRTMLHGVPAYPGTGIRAYQAKLIARGWNLGPAGADGKLGPTTTRVLKAFQSEKGLTPDGQPGPMTWTALYARPL